ncbi:MAG: sigma-70 family RNA polymerase sigma factor, partial [Solirubrobacterales bacterium]|nr:sigma-70 family RNA polymerase sigma factor [Solirubrobacterales bacterium]
MSPVTLRRYRAERLLRREFAGMQARVIGVVAARLRGCGVTLDECDLEACYAGAWQGLYMAILEGQEVANPVGWLVLVTFRRAIEESRSRGRIDGGARAASVAADGPTSDLHSRSASGEECDLAAELDDRTRLRHLFEGLRARLGEREREAAVLCYLQGLPRAEAAARMGVSDARMRKLMDGAGDGNPGVAGKVGALVRSIRDGDWCKEQGSLMRALAFGILDPAGERYQLALAHRGECPACRAYVVSLRGLAAALPPTLLPWGVGGGVLARLGEG